MPDPVWLPDVLRRAGLEVRVHQPHGSGANRCGGAFENGHGDFGDIWGMMFHHTGSYGETENGIAHHPSLGLCSQCLVTREGVWILCGVGIANHAGLGSYPGIPTNDGNRVLIGVEVAHDGGGSEARAKSLQHRALWSDEQYESVVTGFAACLAHMGKPPSRAIAHREYAGAQGKWDPGNIDMNIFRADLAQLIAGGQLEQGDDEMGWLDTQVRNFKNTGMSWKDVLWFMDRNTSQARDQLLGPDDGEGGILGWKLLGRSKIDPTRDNTLVEALAEHKTETASELAEIKGALTTILEKLEDRA